MDVNELIDWVATGIGVSLCASCGGVGSTCINDCPAPTSDGLRQLAKQILSHPDLALIDRERKISHETCYDVNVEEPWRGEYQTAFRNGQRHLIHLGYLPVIPLAEAIKENDEEKNLK